MNKDAIFAFGASIVAAAIKFFMVVDPAIAGVLTEIQNLGLALGAVLHLDGK